MWPTRHPGEKVGYAKEGDASRNRRMCAIARASGKICGRIITANPGSRGSISL